MKVAFPHMGTMYIPLKALFKTLGVECVIPRRPTKMTLTEGVRNSPELACLPLKVNIGDFIDALEQGADTLILCGGCGPCRLGYYAEVQENILRDLGYAFKFIALEPNPRQFLTTLKSLNQNKSLKDVLYALYLVWHKAKALDEVYKMSLYIRPREMTKGETTNVLKGANQYIDNAENIKQVKSALQRGLQELNAIEVDKDRTVLKVGIIGEIYVAIEDLVNQNIDQALGHLGVEVQKKLYLSDYLRSHILPDVKARWQRAQSYSLANPYLEHFVGGHGLDSIGQTVRMARQGYDGVIQVLPFSCMPEIVAKGLLPVVSKDYGIPIMTIIFDEHSGEAGIMTRLEAFVDLIRRRGNNMREVYANGSCIRV